MRWALIWLRTVDKEMKTLKTARLQIQMWMYPIRVLRARECKRRCRNGGTRQKRG